MNPSGWQGQEVTGTLDRVAQSRSGPIRLHLPRANHFLWPEHQERDDFGQQQGDREVNGAKDNPVEEEAVFVSRVHCRGGYCVDVRNVIRIKRLG